MTTGYFNLDDGRLYYEVGGPERAAQTLVLGHAAFLDSRMWDDQWAALTGRYRVVRYDMLGYGRSDPVTKPRCRRDDLHRLLDHLGVGRAHFLGCSMGGEIAIDLALEHPELMASLITVNSPPSGFELQGPPPRYILEMIEATRRGDLERASELQLRIWVDGPRREPEQVDAGVRRRAAEMNRIFVANNTWFIADMQPASPLTPPAVARLSEIEAPMLIVTGGLDDPEILRAADVLGQGVRNAKRVMIPNAAHIPNMEQPAEFTRLVLDFLDG